MGARENCHDKLSRAGGYLWCTSIPSRGSSDISKPLRADFPFWFILASSVFVYPGKLLFKGFLPIDDNFSTTQKQLKIS